MAGVDVEQRVRVLPGRSAAAEDERVGQEPDRPVEPERGRGQPPERGGEGDRGQRGILPAGPVAVGDRRGDGGAEERIVVAGRGVRAGRRARAGQRAGPLGEIGGDRRGDDRAGDAPAVAVTQRGAQRRRGAVVTSSA